MCKMSEKRVDPPEDMDGDEDLLTGAWCGHPPSVPGASTFLQPAAPPRPQAAPALPAASEIITQVNASTPINTISGSTRASIATTSGTTGSLEQDPGTFGRGYVQCKAARVGTRANTAVEASNGGSFGKHINISPETVGNMDYIGDGSVYKTFRGCRVSSRGQVVNQTMSSTFDPLTMICTVCEKEHSIIPSDGSDLIVMISDQNFVSTLSGATACVPIIRLENPTLSELFEITLEIFDRTNLPPGTLFMVQSVSHLTEVGSSIYCTHWVNMLRDFGRRWTQVKIGPLPPVLREDTPSTVTTVLLELFHWYKTVYGNCIEFPRTAWEKLITTLGENTEQSLDLANREIRTIALPVSLQSINLMPHKFTVSSSHPATLALTGEATHELLSALLHQLSTMFGCHAHPEIILAREPAELEGMDTQENTGSSTNTTIFVIGSSNTKRLASDLVRRGHKVMDLTVPGWTPTPRNIDALRTTITQHNPDKNAIFICDLLANTAFGFEQVNGTIALPVKLGGRYHMQGRVTICSKESMELVMGKLVTIFDIIPGQKICTPPLPRYLHSPCCDDIGHCEGNSDPEHASELLSSTISVRKVMRDFLHSRVSNIWVPDTVTMLATEADSSRSKSDVLSELFSGDGVHLNDAGAEKLANIVDNIVMEKITAANSVSGRAPAKEYFWRGFVSPVGSSRPKNISCLHAGGGKWRGSSCGTGSGGRGGRSYPPPPAGRRRH